MLCWLKSVIINSSLSSVYIHAPSTWPRPANKINHVAICGEAGIFGGDVVVDRG